MPKPNLNQIRAVGDFATNINWTMRFITAPIALRNQFTDLSGFDVRCETSGIPTRDGSKTPIDIRGHTVYQPAIEKPNGSLEFAFVESIDNYITNFFVAWREAKWARNTGSGVLKTELEARIQIDRLNRQDEKIYSYRMIVFPENFSPGVNLQGTSADIIRPSITMSYDDFEEGATLGS